MFVNNEQEGRRPARAPSERSELGILFIIFLGLLFIILFIDWKKFASLKRGPDWKKFASLKFTLEAKF
jgi:hypothetical protein